MWSSYNTVSGNMSGTFSVACWNIMGRSPQESTYGKIVKELSMIGADIVCIQEAFPSTERLDELIRIRNYSAVKSNDFFNKGEDFDANVILSIYPIKNYGNIIFPELFNPVNHKREHDHECLWADIVINKHLIRVYNTHLAIKGIGIKERLESLRLILKHASSIKYPVIICGDMNTTVPHSGLWRICTQILHREQKISLVVDGRYYPQDEKYAFNDAVKSSGFADLLDINKATWSLPHTSIELAKLKLDWFFVKALEKISVEQRAYASSDHRPAYIKLRF